MRTRGPTKESGSPPSFRRADTGTIEFSDLPPQVQAGFATSEPGVFLQYIFPTDNLWEKAPAAEMEDVTTDEVLLQVLQQVPAPR